MKWKTAAMMKRMPAAFILPSPSPFAFGPQQQTIEPAITPKRPASAETRPHGTIAKPISVTIAKPSAVPPMHLAELTSGDSSGLEPHMVRGLRAPGGGG